MRDIEEIKRANPLTETISRLTGQEVRVRHAIRCPFHDDKTPSLHIYEDGHWHCFGCGAHGDVLDFVGRFYYGAQYDPSVHFTEVIDRLGGLDIKPVPDYTPPVRKPEKPRLTFDMADVERWHRTMPAERADYWLRRNLSPNAVGVFRLGWDGRRYVIPLIYRNVVFGLKRRKADDVDDGHDAKYMMAKGSRAGLFNADVLFDSRHAVICEGEIDAMLVYQAGYAAVSSTAGAGFWKPHWSKLFAASRKITVIYDNDEAGEAGALKVRRMLRRANIVKLPEGVNDVGDLFSEAGRAEAEEWLRANLGEPW
jgi:hypothetical protein